MIQLFFFNCSNHYLLQKKKKKKKKKYSYLPFVKIFNGISHIYNMYIYKPFPYSYMIGEVIIQYNNYTNFINITFNF
jgi:hypothetical protein